ncbi:HesA/MoeB/ThiF family protein [Thiolapillus brandeum]|uniref:Molybdopterin-synthase adenylyltransferase n=1 Tax=Thiolapillus brandeum TaxID=1076588 RepID=A0A7U6GGI5_9GAMM|nr:molybdopterin-synthase adenylyltransferase MoeB [Thiolapillus brandeum]BAO43219.1 molybdopterin biosynthesis protein MoeB [Thiolapillus brandeum]
MNDEQLLQYSRQIMLPQIDVQGQERLLGSRVLIMGLGGLGSPVAMYLAVAGVGELILADFDRVDLSNLQRQIIHTRSRLEQPKTRSGAAMIGELNPDCKTRLIESHMDEAQIVRQVAQADLVMDCTDNFTSRFAINRACVSQGVPLVSGSAIRWEGQVSVFCDQPGAPCYHCLYGDTGDLDDSCTNNGILAPVAGIIGSIQATEALKLLTGAGEPLSGRLLLIDGLSMQIRSLTLKADPHCPVCGNSQP